MADSDFLPNKESELNEWAVNFNTKLVAAGPGGGYGLVSGQITSYGVLFGSWTAAYTLARENSTRTPSTIAAKNTAKEALVNGTNGIRQLVAIIQADPDTTDEQRQDLQITVPSPEPTPVPIPTVPPVLNVEKTLGRSVRLRLRDLENPDRRGKPDGVTGATILMFVGEEPPVNTREWAFLMNTTRPLFDIVWPLDVASGAQVWLLAFWFNTRGESSPSSDWLSLRVADAATQAQAA